MKANKYVTTNEYKGMGYYDIADLMTREGNKMNHSTVRNIVIRGFSKIAKNITESYGEKYSAEKIKEIAKSPDFQNSVISLMKGNKIGK
tara:strand:- start:871 stop:1137 length:267 start_codon:yes stop_codon:yes gene_type:complete